MMRTTTYKVTGKYVIVSAFAVLFSFILHEFFHWLTGEILGHEMVMSFNKAYSITTVSPEDEQVISAAGPVITLLQALIVFLVMRRSSKFMLFPFLVVCLYMRLLAGVMSFINLNDEARISAYLGIGAFTLPLVMVAIIFYMVYRITRIYNFDTKIILKTVGLIMLFSSILILADRYFKAVLLR